MKQIPPSFVTRATLFQTDVQYVINPGGYHDASKQVVFGLQLSVPL